MFYDKIKMKTEAPERSTMKDLPLWPTPKDLGPIMFLSRLLTPAEKNYWPTELETAGLVWTVKKVRHLIESSRQEVRVQTDHSSSVDISNRVEYIRAGIKGASALECCRGWSLASALFMNFCL